PRPEFAEAREPDHRRAGCAHYNGITCCSFRREPISSLLHGGRRLGEHRKGMLHRVVVDVGNDREIGGLGFAHDQLHRPFYRLFGAECNGITHGDEAAFGLGEAESIEGAYHTTDDFAVRQGRARVRYIVYGAVATNHEPHVDAPAQARVGAETALVTESETAMVLPNDALNDLRRQPARHLDVWGSHPNTARGVITR